jgi:hypothetical protein
VESQQRFPSEESWGDDVEAPLLSVRLVLNAPQKLPRSCAEAAQKLNRSCLGRWGDDVEAPLLSVSLPSLP